jgi:hypothetical protein
VSMRYRAFFFRLAPGRAILQLARPGG